MARKLLITRKGRDFRRLLPELRARRIALVRGHSMTSIALLEPYVRLADSPEKEPSDVDWSWLLILGALRKVEQASRAQDCGKPVEKGFHIGRATAIVDALRDALDLASGGQMARDLARACGEIDHWLQQSVKTDGPDLLPQARDRIRQLCALHRAARCRTSRWAGTA